MLKPQGTHPPDSCPSSLPKPTRTKQSKRHTSPKPQNFLSAVAFMTQLPSPLRTHIYLVARGVPGAPRSLSLTVRHSAGVTITQNWTTASLLDTKAELADVLAPGVKVDLQNLWNPSKSASAAQKLTLGFKNPNAHARAFINHAQATGNIDAVVDITAGHEGFLVGGEAGYDLQKAAITKYAVGLGYQTPTYAFSMTGVQNLSVIAATYYQKVNSTVEVGAKAGYDVQAASASGLEIASKYRLDATSFAKVKVNDRGIAALAYSTKLNSGTTLGLGLSLDTNKLNEAGHKIGTSLTFEG